jgi:hypothetical protein
VEPRANKAFDLERPPARPVMPTVRSLPPRTTIRAKPAVALRVPWKTASAITSMCPFSGAPERAQA